MAVRKNSLRGSVVLKWESSGKPAWDVKKTLAVCIHVDNKLENKGLKPAPQFRKKTKLDDHPARDIYGYGMKQFKFSDLICAGVIILLTMLVCWFVKLIKG